jgi:DNA primase
MRYQESREDIAARVKERADIVKIIGESVELKRSGSRFLGLCPFHGEKTPSFTVHPGQQFFHCFGCGESGDVFSFMMKRYNLDFPAALKELAGRYQIALPEKPRSEAEERLVRKRQAMYAVNDRCAAIFRRYLVESPGAAGARGYLERRGVGAAIREKFGIGYAPAVETAGWDFLGRQLSGDDRLVAEELGLLVRKEDKGTYDRFRDRVLFPIFDIKGRILGFGGRILGEGQPKYMNSPESPVFTKSLALLGLFQQAESIRRQKSAVVVEGNFDLISLVAKGVDNVVAPLGTALTREQLRLLKRFADEAVLLFDGDAAGIKAAVRAVPHFLAEQMTGRVALLPPGHDPDTFVRQEGPEALRQILAQAESLPEFVLAALVREHGLTLDGKGRIVEEMKPLVEAAASPLQRSVIIAHFSEKLGLPPGRMESLLQGGGGGKQPQRQDVPVADARENREGRIAPLSPAQRHLVTFMIFNPVYFRELEEKGLRSCLAGTVGEILFLQLQAILTKKSEIEPEELFTLLPEGAERNLVSELLMKAPERTGTLALSASPEEELAELLDWLQRQMLQRMSEDLQQQISAAQSRGDAAALQPLLVEKQGVDRQMQGLNDGDH